MHCGKHSVSFLGFCISVCLSDLSRSQRNRGVEYLNVVTEDHSSEVFVLTAIFLRTNNLRETRN